MANGKCYRHGGKSLVGVASATFKHGRYSKVLPFGLAERFAASMKDPDLLELRAELALVDSRMEALLAQMRTHEGGRWSDAAAVYQRIRQARRRRRPADAEAALTELGSLLEQGQSDIESWDQVERFLTLRARIVRVESKRLKDLQQMVTIDRVWTLVAALVQSVRNHVNDRAALVRIQADFRRLTGRTDN